MSDEAKRKPIIRLPYVSPRPQHDPLTAKMAYETPKILFDAMLLECKDG